jgi:hypothetical protein
MGATIDYSTTAASNTTVGGVNIAEGMAPGSVNDAMRAMMADSRKWQLDWSGVTTAGSSNAYTMTCNQGITAYADGMRFCFRADRSNTGAATLNIDARGAKALRKVSSGALVALIANDIIAKAFYDVVFNTADDVFVIVGEMLPTVETTATDVTTALPNSRALFRGRGWTYAPVQLTTSGTAFDFNDIPSWVTEIKLLLVEVSLSGADDLAVAIGDAGGFEATGYVSASAFMTNAVAISADDYTNAFGIIGDTSAISFSGEFILTKFDGSTWVSAHTFRRGASSVVTGGGAKTLSATLTRVRLTRIGTDTFDTGSVVAMWR